MSHLPRPMPVVNPPFAASATRRSLDFQTVLPVTSTSVPSLMCAIAFSCDVCPTSRFTAPVIERLSITGSSTCASACALRLANVESTSQVPGSPALSNPSALIVATVDLSVDHNADAVTSTSDPSLIVAVAFSCDDLPGPPSDRLPSMRRLIGVGEGEPTVDFTFAMSDRAAAVMSHDPGPREVTRP